jgi:predicted house-cleaning noncanonical NTP pyrophosphatase (MazG superfamily)
MGKRLVRDRALDNWRVPGAEHQVRPVVDEKEHQLLLVQKLIEETMEVVFSEDRDELLKELADLLSVMEGCARANGIGWFEVLDKQAERDAASGPFIDGMVWETDR